MKRQLFLSSNVTNVMQNNNFIFEANDAIDEENK